MAQKNTVTLQCDFCGTEDPVRSFACRNCVNGVVFGTEMQSQGDWLACMSCGFLIG